MAIQKPMRATEYPDRNFDCQTALDAAFRRAIDHIAMEAAEAGWSPDDTARAIIGLALTYAAEQRMDPTLKSVMNVRRRFLN